MAILKAILKTDFRLSGQKQTTSGSKILIHGHHELLLLHTSENHAAFVLSVLLAKSRSKCLAYKQVLQIQDLQHDVMS